MKKMRQALTAALLAFSLVIVMLPGMQASAANPVRQVGIKSTSITVKWTRPKLSSGDKLTSYLLYAGKDYSSKKLIRKLSPSTTSYTFKKLKAGATKYVEVKYHFKTSYGAYTYSLGSVYDAKTIPGKVTGLKQERWYYFINSVDVVWNGKTSADGYQYQFAQYNGKGVRNGKVDYAASKPSASFDKIKNTMIYTIKVRPYTMFNGKRYNGPWTGKTYLFTQPQITSATVASKGKLKNKLYVKWDKVAGATSYRIFVSTKAEPWSAYKSVKVVGSSAGSATIAKFNKKAFNPKTKYYVYVQTQKKVGKKVFNSGKLYYWSTN